VNANPSGSRTPQAGGQGEPEARREQAATKESSPGLIRVVGDAERLCAANRPSPGSIGGPRHAKTACRGAPSMRRAAQGSGGDRRPRHVVSHLATHLLLSANTSDSSDAVRPNAPGDARLRPVAELTVHQPSSRWKAQHRDQSSPRPEASDTELVQPGWDVVSTLVPWRSRGKGVLAV
jgi:hypothetical protein